MTRRGRLWTIAVALVVAVAGITAWRAGGRADLPATIWVRSGDGPRAVYDRPDGQALPDREFVCWDVGGGQPRPECFVRSQPSAWSRLRASVRSWTGHSASLVMGFERTCVEPTGVTTADGAWTEYRRYTHRPRSDTETERNVYTTHTPR